MDHNKPAYHDTLRGRSKDGFEESENVNSSFWLEIPNVYEVRRVRYACRSTHMQPGTISFQYLDLASRIPNLPQDLDEDQ